MSDELRDQLTELGQRLTALEGERQQAMAKVGALVREHRDDIPLRQIAQLTNLSRTTIYKMLEGR